MRASRLTSPMTVLLTGCVLAACDPGVSGSSGGASRALTESTNEPTEATDMTPDQKPPEKVVKSDEEWREILTPEQYRITREAGTERAFTGEYTDTTTPGIYMCVCCEAPLFTSETKFHSGCGWPSFFNFMPDAITEHADDSFGMRRVEVRCARCDAHLGHVFKDGPVEQGGLRYCINSAALTLDERPRPDAPDVSH